MRKIKSIGVRSVFRVSLVLGAVSGILWGFIVMIQFMMDRSFLEGIVALILSPFLFALLGGLLNALMAFIYNRVAERLGGIEIDLE